VIVGIDANLLKRLFDYALKADQAGVLGDCHDSPIPDGCQICTDLETVQLLIWRSQS
jgi:hypothetical protein